MTDRLTVPLCVACPEIVEVLNQLRGPPDLPEPRGSADVQIHRAIEAIEENRQD